MSVHEVLGAAPQPVPDDNQHSHPTVATRRARTPVARPPRSVSPAADNEYAPSVSPARGERGSRIRRSEVVSLAAAPRPETPASLAQRQQRSRIRPSEVVWRYLAVTHTKDQTTQRFEDADALLEFARTARSFEDKFAGESSSRLQAAAERLVASDTTESSPSPVHAVLRLLRDALDILPVEDRRARSSSSTLSAPETPVETPARTTPLSASASAPVTSPPAPLSLSSQITATSSPAPSDLAAKPLLVIRTRENDSREPDVRQFHSFWEVRRFLVTYERWADIAGRVTTEADQHALVDALLLSGRVLKGERLMEDLIHDALMEVPLPPPSARPVAGARTDLPGLFTQRDSLLAAVIDATGDKKAALRVQADRCIDRIATIAASLGMPWLPALDRQDLGKVTHRLEGKSLVTRGRPPEDVMTLLGIRFTDQLMYGYRAEEIQAALLEPSFNIAAARDLVTREPRQVFADKANALRGQVDRHVKELQLATGPTASNKTTSQERKGPAWNLRTKAKDVSRVDGSLRPEDDKKLAQAWDAILGVVEPDVLQTVRCPRMLIDPRATNEAYASDSMTIELRYTASVARIVHEFGHHLEYQLPSHLWYSLAHLLQVDYEGGGKPLANYNDETLREPVYQVADKWIDPQLTMYATTYYTDGGTELLSLALEHCLGDHATEAPKSREVSFFAELLRLEPRLALVVLRTVKPQLAKNWGLGP
jgi:hypothetical protein